MFGWGKSSKTPAPAAGAGGEVAVQKVDRIEFHNLIKPPPRFGGGGVIGANPRKPVAQPPAISTASRMPDGSPREDINQKASRLIEDTKKRWQLAHKSFRATGTGR